MLPPDLIRSINSGRCFAFIGAGPSIELGYPSWSDLAEYVCNHVLKEIPTADRLSYEKFMSNQDFPALLRQAEVDMGERSALIACVKSILQPTGVAPTPSIYDYLARWPFACYLTTNFDNEIQNALNRRRLYFQVCHNSATDLSLFRDGISNLIAKIHSDLDHPDAVVLTSADYNRILTGPGSNVFQAKIRQIFEMFNVFIIGHSMKDPDLQLILSLAKHTASPLRPIHMLLADATSGEIREFMEQYNIRLTPYDNSDKTHRNLRNLLSVSNKWISERDFVTVSAPSVSEEEVIAASSLLLFQRLHAMKKSSSESTTLDSLLLFTLASTANPITKDALLKRPALSSLADSADGIRAVNDGLVRLVEAGMVTQKKDIYIASDRGKKQADIVRAQRKLEEEQAFGQFELEIKSLLQDASDADYASAKEALRNALVGAFRSRGITMANIIMADHSLSADELSDLFEEVRKHASGLASDLRSSFLAASHAFLVEPNGPQKSYLASVSQGFFLYHMIGMDPTCTKNRKKLFTNTCWFVDSSVLLPLLAIGCNNHKYAVDLFKKLKAMNATLFTTEALLQEVRIHLNWAMNHPPESPDFQAAVMVQGGFKQNLFLDGYVRQSAEGAIGTFSDYFAHVIPSGRLDKILAEISQEYGITVLRASDVEGFIPAHRDDIEEAKELLTEHRRSRGTFRGTLQVEAEAEVLVLIRNLRQGNYKLPVAVEPSCRVYFVSQSRALDVVSRENCIVTWTPEAVYRYVSSVPGQELQDDLLQECMLQEYFYAGVSFVDKPRYVQFFGQSIRQAKISYLEQIDGYLQQTEQTHRRNDYDAAFDSTPDLEKPFFVSQMGWDLARRTAEREAATKQYAEKVIDNTTTQVRDAEKRAKNAEKLAETERRARITAEQKVAHLQHLADPKHVRKRARQAKKRKRKK